MFCKRLHCTIRRILSQDDNDGFFKVLNGFLLDFGSAEYYNLTVIDFGLRVKEMKEKTGGAQDLTQGKVGKKMLSFFFPILIGLLFQQLYNTADAVIVGHFVGDDALAAVGGTTASITNLIIGFFTGLNAGATVLISQMYGSGDEKTLSRVLHTAVIFCSLVGLSITVLGYFFTPGMLTLLGNPTDIQEESVLYLRIYLEGAIFLLLYNLFQGTMQSVGDSARPLKYLITSCLTNIVLDLLFVGVLDLNVAGAAWASVLSMMLCTALAAVHLMREKGPHKLSVKKLDLEWSILKRILRIGLPGGVQSSMYAISNLIIMAAVNTFGTQIVTAWTATGKLDGFYWSTSNAFGIALCAFVGQCYGAGKLERMKQGVRFTMKTALVTTVCLSVLLLSVARPAYHIFLKEEQTIEDAITIMWYFVPFYFIWSFIEVLTGTFRGVGDTLRPMIITMIGTCVFRVIWMLFVVPAWHTVMSVSIVYGISWVLTAGAFIIYYLKGKWLKQNSITDIQE